MTFAIAFVCLSLCFVGCSFGSNPTIERIDVKGSIQTEYAINEELNLNDAKLILTYSNDSQKEIKLIASMISGFDTTTVGNKTLTVTYKEKTTQINYVVKNEIKVENKRVKFGEYFQQEEYKINQDGSLTLTNNYAYSEAPVVLVLNNDFTGTFSQTYQEHHIEIEITWEVKNGTIEVRSNETDITNAFSVTDNGMLRIDFNGYASILAFHDI